MARDKLDWMRSLDDGERIRELLEKVLRDHTAKSVIAVDADHTLWDGDSGEAFLGFLVRTKVLPKRYLLDFDRLVHTDPSKAYRECVRCMVGCRATGIDDAAKHFDQVEFDARTIAHHYVLELLRHFWKAGFESRIVSASPIQVVRRCVDALQLPIQSAIGVQSEIREGLLTDTIIEPAPIGQSKVAALEADGFKTILLAIGDSRNDVPMMQAAKYGGILVVKKKDPFRGQFEIAEQYGWPILWV